MNKVISFVTVCAFVFAFTPLAQAAGDVTVTTTNNATVTNTARVTADTGDNVSRGARGARGARGGDVDGVFAFNNDGGNGGGGGQGGDGGSITTGVAVSESYIGNEVNTTNVAVTVDDCGCEDPRYDESLVIASREGSSAVRGEHTSIDIDAEHEETDAAFYFNHDEGSFFGDETTLSGTYSNEETEIKIEGEHAEFAAEEEHDDFFLAYSREYVGGDDDDVNVTTNNSSADVTNDAIVGAYTGNNDSLGARGARGARGGDASGFFSASNDGGNGGGGGRGGNGGTIRTGDAGSYSEMVSVVNSSVVRVNRN